MLGREFGCDRDFFEEFARTLSLYGQQVISGVRSPNLSEAPDLLGALDELDELEDDLGSDDGAIATQTATAVATEQKPETPKIDPESGPVQVYPLGRSNHRLWIQPPPPMEGQAAPAPLDLELSTLQLFDVVEVVDQFYADPRTLPDVALGLKSVSRRDLPGRSAMAERIWPAVIGTSTLAAAAGVMFLLPHPETVERPEDRVLTPEEVDQLNQPALSVPGSGEPPQANPNSSPSITPLEAPASTTEDGGTDEENKTDTDGDDNADGAEESDQSSAPRSTAPVARRSHPQRQAVSQSFRSQAERSKTASVPDGKVGTFSPEMLSQLNVILRQSIDEAWSDRKAVKEDLEFRVGVSADGKVVGYRPVNQPAREFRSDRLPLRKILFNPVQSRGTGPKPSESLALFKVILTDEGQTQVSLLLGSDGKPVFHPPLPSQSSDEQPGE